MTSNYSFTKTSLMPSFLLFFSLTSFISNQILIIPIITHKYTHRKASLRNQNISYWTFINFWYLRYLCVCVSDKKILNSIKTDTVHHSCWSSTTTTTKKDVQIFIFTIYMTKYNWPGMNSFCIRVVVVVVVIKHEKLRKRYWMNGLELWRWGEAQTID